MRVLITESKLYNSFIHWMDMDVKGGILKWRTDSSGTIYLIKNKDTVVLVKPYKSEQIFVTDELFDEIQNFFPFDEVELLKLIGEYVARKLNRKVSMPKLIKDRVHTYGDTFPI